MRRTRFGRVLGVVTALLITSTVVSGCVLLRPALGGLVHQQPSVAPAPAEPFLLSGPPVLAADPISVTLRNGIPVVRLCENATIDLASLSETLIATDPSKGYLDVWVAEGTHSFKSGDELVVGSASSGLKPLAKGQQSFDFSSNTWKFELDDVTAPAGHEIIQKFRGQDLATGVWLDHTGRAAAGPCVLAGG